MPQGAVLKPFLILVRVNDISLHLSSKMKLYIDDCITHKEIFYCDEKQKPFKIRLSQHGELLLRVADEIKCRKMIDIQEQ